MDSNTKLLIHTVTKYLHDEFDPESLSEFHDADALKLFSQLKQIMPIPSIVKRLDQIKDVFVKFFNNLGEITVEIQNLENIKVSTNIDPRKIKAMRLLENYAEHLDDSQGPNLLILNEEITNKLRNDLKCQSDESFRNIIRHVLPFVFEVGDKYAVLFGKARITIRIHMEKPSEEKRFNGLPEEELENLVASLFPDMDKELPLLMKRAFVKVIDFGVISNAEFEQKHIKIMQQELTSIINLRSDQDKEINKGISNFILRKQFDTYHQLLADQLITAIMNKKGNAEVFLNYYTQKNITVAGVKYKLPPLIDSQGTIWSLPNIKNIASQHNNDLAELTKKNDFIEKMEKILDTIDDDIKKEQTEANEAKTAFEKANNELHELGNMLSVNRGQLKKLRSTNGFDTAKEAEFMEYISTLEKKEFELMKIRDSSDRNVTKQENDVKAMISKKQNTTIRLNSEIDKLEQTQKHMSDLQRRFELMLEAIGSALSKKKEKI